MSQTEKRPYLSRFGAGNISPVQWLAESMCDRLARRDKVTLPHHFWNLPRWEKQFVLQTVHAAKLLKSYPIEFILAALRTTQGKTIYSLGFRSKLIPLIEEEKRKDDLIKQMAQITKEDYVSQEDVKELASNEVGRPGFIPKKTLIGKLRDE